MGRRKVAKTSPAARGVNGAPIEIREWFAGKRSMPITALVHPDFYHVSEWWADYAERNPGSTLPPDAPQTLLRAMFGRAAASAVARGATRPRAKAVARERA